MKVLEGMETSNKQTWAESTTFEVSPSSVKMITASSERARKDAIAVFRGSAGQTRVRGAIGSASTGSVSSEMGLCVGNLPLMFCLQ